jgi:hypothetical protein
MDDKVPLGISFEESKMLAWERQRQETIDKRQKDKRQR